MLNSPRERRLAAAAGLVLGAFAFQRFFFAPPEAHGGAARQQARLAYYEALLAREPEIRRAYGRRPQSVERKAVGLSTFYKEADRMARGRHVRLRHLKPVVRGKEAGAMITLEGSYAGLLAVLTDLEREFPDARLGRFSLSARGQESPLSAQVEIYLAAK